MNRALAGAAVFLALGVAACTRPNVDTAATNAAATRPATASVGTILSIRAVNASADSAPWRAAFFADVGATTAARDNAANALMEFIVRSGDGATISVVQSNELALRAGDRVTIVRDTRTHLVRLPDV